MIKFEDYISTVEAAKIAKVSKVTIITWCQDFKIGTKIAGRWKVNKKKLDEVLSGYIGYGVNDGKKKKK